MARVFTQKAAKDYPSKGIKKGDIYYSWTLHKQPRQISATRPRPSQLTGSEKLSTLYGLRESIEDAKFDSLEDWAAFLNETAGCARDVGEEYQDSLDNMPESLQQGSTGEAIQEKIDEIEAWAAELEDAANDIEALDIDDYADSDSPQDAMMEDARSRAEDASSSLSL
jgi:hypothetical protein